MANTEEKSCPVCGSKMVDKGFSGDWKVHDCSDSDCETKIECAHASNPTEDGFTMESLERASEYANNE